MQEVGKVLSLFISSEESSNHIEKEEIIVDTKGIVEDKHYNADIQKSVLITSTESYELLQRNHIDIAYGSLGENLLIDYNPYTLPIGTRLQIANVILEISQNCTLCNHLSRINKQVPKLLKNDRGIFAKVIQSGSIKVDDSIYLLS